ncbi:hypothetical protein GCM10023203_00940 [Actinomycetospora straminea]|uniref:Uncharacterized protein n=1 Tax=Actinomycetospora straminea TaxID=663607 RepID=A0ABP9DSX2_9PSEU
MLRSRPPGSTGVIGRERAGSVQDASTGIARAAASKAASWRSPTSRRSEVGRAMSVEKTPASCRKTTTV